MQRNSPAASFIGKLIKKDTYWVEQVTFLIGMLSALVRYKPAVIYYSDFILGTFLFHLRKFFNFKYKLLFSNGAPNGPPFKTEDHVQQLLPVYLDSAVKQGAPEYIQTLLPYGFKIDTRQRLSLLAEKEKIINDLGISPGQKIILSVGAINKHHKRMDYIINEVSALPPDYFLIILGQFEEETPGLLSLAADKLPNRHFIANVPFEDVEKYYSIADYFVLASLIEGFGRVLVEALSYGLPCIVNDYVNARHVLGKYGVYIDMQDEGALASALTASKPGCKKKELINAAYELYSWDKLKEEYIAMISNLIN